MNIIQQETLLRHEREKKDRNMRLQNDRDQSTRVKNAILDESNE